MKDDQLAALATPPITFFNVLVGFSLLLIDIGLSSYFKLGLSKDLLIAAARCVVQLSLLGVVLETVFEAQNPLAVAGLGLALMLLGAQEVTFTRSKRRTTGLFFSTVVSLLISVAPIAVIGSRFAIVHKPFWSPQTFIPICGMLCGSAIGGAAVAINYVTREVVENRDKLETYLAHGSSRMEACMPMAAEALKVALLPTVNQMAVVGLIAIPGMMTGAILGGADVAQAARMQMIIMFLIAACTTLCVCSSVFFLLSTLVDDQHRIRLDRVSSGPSLPVLAFNKVREAAVKLYASFARNRSAYSRVDT